jgi:hypothetical protein
MLGLRAVLKLLLTLVVLCYNNFLDVAGQVLLSEVINFRLGLVITPKRASLSEVVVCAACTLTTTSMLMGDLAVWVMVANCS